MSCPCGKNARQKCYCHEPNCGNMASKVDLPKPNVEIVTTESNEKHVVISRDGKGKSYKINETYNEDNKIKDVVEKVINDPYTGEWLR